MLAALARLVAVELHVVGPPFPRRLWPQELGPCTRWIEETTDAGVVQDGDLDVDAEATAKAVDAWLKTYDDGVERWARWLGGHADLVVCDASALGVAAAARARIPSAGIANFSWDWIYRRLGLDEAADRCAKAYAEAGLLLRAEPSAPMAAFPTTRAVGLIGRHPGADRWELRRRLGIAMEERLAMIALRSPWGGRLRLPPSTWGLRYLVAAGAEGECDARADIVTAPADMAFVDQVAASDVLVAKPGYGILGDAAGAATPLLWVGRRGFPEDEVLEAWLAGWPWCRRVQAEALAEGHWLAALEEAASVARPEALAVSQGTRRTAESLAQMLRGTVASAGGTGRT